MNLKEAISLIDKDVLNFKELPSEFRNNKETALKAVKTDEVYLTDGNQYFNRPGPRLLDSIKIMDDIINNSNVYNFKNQGWRRLSEN